jgi:hypothetical protein
MRILGTLLLSVASFGSACAQNPGAIAGIDHIPLAVRDLDLATMDFERLGFSIKPGRQHQTGIRNRHIKFPDGSGLELITVQQATDELTTAYLKHLKAGDGPAYVSFHVRDTAGLASALVGAGIGFEQAAGLTTFKDPKLGFVFISADNRSPTDRPEHFAHSNGAFAMSEVWIACEDCMPLKRLLSALGATSRSVTVRVPEPTDGEAFELQNGRVVIVPSRNQIIVGRPVVGAVMSVRWPVAASPSSTSGPADSSASSTRTVVAPDSAHGLWLEFRVEQ